MKNLFFIALLMLLVVQLFAQDYEITPGTAFIYENAWAKDPSICEIDANHYLCTYTYEIFGHWTGTGKVEVLNVDPESGEISSNNVLEFNSENGRQTVLSKLDETHFLCLYCGSDYQGNAVVFEVDPETWEVSVVSSYVFAAMDVDSITLEGIGDVYDVGMNYFLCTYNGGEDWNGIVGLLCVDMGSWNIDMIDTLIFEDDFDNFPHLIQLNENSYFFAYNTRYPDSTGNGVVVSVNFGDGEIILINEFVFVPNPIYSVSAQKIDDDNVLVIYQDTVLGNKARVIRFDSSTLEETVLHQNTVDPEAEGILYPSLEQMDETHFLCTYRCEVLVDEMFLDISGRANVLTVNVENGDITSDVPYDFGSPQYIMGRLSKLTDEKYLCVFYQEAIPPGQALILEVEQTGLGADQDEFSPQPIEINNYPNPFNPETTLNFSLKEAAEVNIDIFNIKGQRVKQLVSGQQRAAQHSVIWNGQDDEGKPISSGIYLYRLTTENETLIRKMMLVK